jgi:orotidine-5'-phosphate decarboxylase
MTVSPYPGFGALTTFFDLAIRNGGGVFVLAATSNPDGRALQRARTDDGATVAQGIVDQVADRNKEPAHDSAPGAESSPIGSIGVVVGVTAGDAALDLADLNGPVLAPGLGAQGGRPADLAGVFAGVRGIVLPSSSREILSRGPAVTALRAVALSTRDECRAALAPAPR